MKNENISYQNDCIKTINCIDSIIRNNPKKGRKAVKIALKKIINTNMTKNNIYYIVYKLFYFSLLLQNNIEYKEECLELVLILKTAIENNRSIQNNFKEIKKLLDTNNNHIYKNITKLYLDTNDAIYLNNNYINQGMNLLNLEKSNIQYNNISIIDIQEYNKNIKKRIRIINETK